ncbi:MAG: hypothetical protein Q7S97_11750 [Polaromonas sp.]|nr:hypothetical protein [Polaromonas sp.]
MLIRASLAIERGLCDSLLHPDALMAPQGPLTIKKVLSSRPIAYPFNLLDCSVPSEGGSAVLVVSPRLAARYTQKPCYLLGFGEKPGIGAHRHAGQTVLRDPRRGLQDSAVRARLSGGRRSVIYLAGRCKSPNTRRITSLAEPKAWAPLMSLMRA